MAELLTTLPWPAAPLTGADLGVESHASGDSHTGGGRDLPAARGDATWSGGTTGGTTTISRPAAMSLATMPELSERAIRDLITVFKLVADETRLRILLYLARQGEVHVRALCDLLGQSQPAVSHHLALLRENKLIESRRQGKHNYYHLLPDRAGEVLDLVFATTPAPLRRIRIDEYLLSYHPPDSPEAPPQP